MKKPVIVFALLLLVLQAYCQEAARKKSNFSSGITLFSDLWQESEANMNPRAINQGFNFSFMRNIPLENSNVSFSLGSGIGAHNLFSDAILRQDSNNVYYFTKISNIDTSAAYDYKKSKISVTYWDFPVEFQYKSKGDFRLALGMKFGFVLSSVQKYKGDDYLYLTGHQIKEKAKDIRNLEKWRYGLTGRIGYKAIELYGFYSLTKLFKKDEGPELFPLSIGISLRPAFLEF